MKVYFSLNDNRLETLYTGIEQWRRRLTVCVSAKRGGQPAFESPGQQVNLGIAIF